MLHAACCTLHAACRLFEDRPLEVLRHPRPCVGCDAIHLNTKAEHLSAEHDRHRSDSRLRLPCRSARGHVWPRANKVSMHSLLRPSMELIKVNIESTSKS